MLFVNSLCGFFIAQKLGPFKYLWYNYEITIAELIQKLEECSLLEEAQKTELLTLIPAMQDEELRHLAALLLQMEAYSQQKEEDWASIHLALTQLFALINRACAKESKHIYFEEKEKSVELNEHAEEEQLLLALNKVEHA